MRIRILCIGESKATYLKEGEKDFMNRLSHYARIQIDQIRPIKHAKSKPDDQILKEEADLFLGKMVPSDLIIVLDCRGKMLTSEQFSDQLSNWRVHGKREIVFIVGGPLGLHVDVEKKADLILSLSKMTFTHDMIRLILLEQIYRAFTILKGEKYHK